ncbi:MAG: DNA-protecting protein DprA [Rubrivivax sp.]|nr:MAG: DNA-protecting protein DprA [Rubrivivax sp.]
MDLDELSAWLRLLLTPRVGPAAARRLLAALGSPQAVFAAAPDALAALVAPREAKALRQVPEGLDAQLALTREWLAQADPAPGAERAVITLADPRYPQALLQASDPPLVLYAQGRLALLNAPAIAMVGSRHPTPQGREHALAFASALSSAGLAVVSGLADGVDGAAHEGALDGMAPDGSGSTIAVVGTGLDRVYPRKHHALAHRIAQHGLILSEFTLGTPPLAPNFPRRNRVVAALARGTLVVEAAVQSGSLITARLASEMGREVFAIPGSIHSPQSRGCHALIKQGAKLVETAQDVMDELQWAHPGLVSAAADEAGAANDEDPVLAAMGYEPVSQEALSARTGLGPAELGVRLLELELGGQVARLPGQLFQRMMAA